MIKLLIAAVCFSSMLTSCVKVRPCQILDLDKSLAPDCVLVIENPVSGETFVLKNKADIKTIIHFIDMQWCNAQPYIHEWVWVLPPNTLMRSTPVMGFVALALKDKDYSSHWPLDYESIWSVDINPLTDPYGLRMIRSIQGRWGDAIDTEEERFLLKEERLLLNKDAWKLYCLLLKIIRKYDSEFEVIEQYKDTYINSGTRRKNPNWFQRQLYTGVY